MILSGKCVNRLQTYFSTASDRACRFRVPVFRAVVREVTVIRSMAPINLIVYYPKTEEAQIELAKRESDVNAAAATQRIKSLNCPTSQKLELLDAVIETVKERSREQT